MDSEEGPDSPDTPTETPLEDGDGDSEGQQLSDVSEEDDSSRKDAESASQDNESNNHPEVVATVNGKSDDASPKYETRKVVDDKNSKSEDAEEQLDFEAEEGECLDTPVAKKTAVRNDTNDDKKKEEDERGADGEASSLEEGEVTDDEERRPEETEPRPVCRFYSRGQCTWGVSCRFLHPGVTDKGNYTMFDMVRSMPAGYGQHTVAHVNVPARVIPVGRTEPVFTESAWERGLRTAKEMLRKASKRKEQDMDFEEKKLHLSLGGAAGRGGSLGPEEDDPDLAAYAGYPQGGSPPTVKKEREDPLRPDRRYDDYRFYGVRDRRPPDGILEPSPSPPRRGLEVRDGFDDGGPGRRGVRRTRMTREVIVQRAPGGGSGRGEEWADPWMRGGGGGVGRSPGNGRGSPERVPVGRVAPRRRYSSGSSYSSSGSSGSSSKSSDVSAASVSPGRTAVRRGVRLSPRTKRDRRSESPRSRDGSVRRRGRPSPVAPVRERRPAVVRAAAANPPAPAVRKRVPSPTAPRQHSANPPQSSGAAVDEFGRTKPARVRPKETKPRSESSSSDSSSSSSGSDSDSRSSGSGPKSAPAGAREARKKGVQPPPQPATASARGLGGLEKRPASKSGGVSLLTPKYLTDALNQRKASEGEKKTEERKRPAASPPHDPTPQKRPVSRREELLKQLKAVEDAIARKRSKV